MAMSRIKNTIQMIDILSTRNVVSLQELSERFEVDIRTIQRMRDDLIDLGYEIKTHRGPHGGVELIRSRPFNISNYSNKEIHEINMGLDRLLGESEFERYGALSKLKHEFSQHSRYRVIEGVETRVPNIDFDLYYALIGKIQVAINEKTKIEIMYQSTQSKSHKRYIVEPYELFVVNRRLYLGALNEKYNARSYRVSRMQSVQILNKKFTEEPSLYPKNIREMLGFDFETYRIKVLVKNFGYYKEFIWGIDQVITPVDDNSYMMEVTLGNEYYAQEFVLLGGHHVEVLEPVSLRNWIIDESKKINELYMTSS